MKISYSIDQQRRLILTTAKGRVTFEDIRGHQDRMLADPDFDASFDQLIDTTTATRFDISPKEALILSERRMFSPTSRRAFVAADSQTFGLGLLMEIYHESLEYADVEVFYSMDQALRWLGARGESMRSSRPGESPA